jgi:hypothetical protein
VALFNSSCNWLCTGLVPSLSGGPDVGNGIAPDPFGNVYITGALTPAPGTTFAFEAQFDSLCNWLCTGLVPSLIGGPDVGNGVAVDPNGNAYITGDMTPAPGTTTAFVAKFLPGCNYMCTGLSRLRSAART